MGRRIMAGRALKDTVLLRVDMRWRVTTPTQPVTLAAMLEVRPMGTPVVAPRTATPVEVLRMATRVVALRTLMLQRAPILAAAPRTVILAVDIPAAVRHTATRVVAIRAVVVARTSPRVIAERKPSLS